MSDLINRADAIEAVTDIQDGSGQRYYLAVSLVDKIRSLQSAEATIGDYPNDLISRSALMEYCSNQKSKSIDNNDIARFPSAEAVQGEWIDVENEPYCECSVCGAYIDNLDDDYAFCPRCGAKMKGGAE